MTFKSICRNLLPQDTRAIELTSAISLIVLSILLQVTVGTTSQMRELHPVNFWTTVTFIFGSLQLYSLIRYQHEEPVRIVTCWIAGSFWVWSSMSGGINNPGDVAAFVLGINCWIAFLINTVILSESWRE